MGDYAVTFARSARRELEALSNTFVIRIFEKIEALGVSPALRDAGSCRVPRIFGG